MQFIDQAEIEVIAGKGGDGIVAFRREKYVPAGGPSGGNGGRGGSVILEADENLQTLLDFRYNHSFKAEDGKRGGPKNKTGANGRDRALRVPCGTIVYDLDTEEMIADLVYHQQQACVAQGGKGGLGNRHFLSNHNRAPEKALPGLPGEERRLRLELKLLAEVGIIGLPNAGKSTLISALSSARPKVADYPFTTLVPNLGIVRKPSGDGTVFADIPGLIAGAHQGVGLGHEFLRHIERTKILIHVIDITAEAPLQDYQTIQDELLAYKPSLAERQQIIVLNKVDAVDEEIEADVKAQFASVTHEPILLISAVARSRLDELLNQVWEMLELVPS
ncbi:GTP-binding protein Obg/CgtA [Halothece sp. PCC 7418]|uniref:GTPase ObgE n=1 Tax=Halothece sp. (strain PCC 7418) TaxID=65093 RepID=UPI0002A06BF9|nr:GTPase ObgE [Halothece sp. PCC 7418]AFZ44432.1 GTP-binding protein Obg/CgtA [Halothece sp. PCC 7418]